VEASTEQEVFEEALAALGELLGERAAADGEQARFEVTASAPDRATLVAEWLSELAYLAEAQGLVPDRAERLKLTETAIEATVVGRRRDPPHLVKAVTYHRLAMWEENGAWRARVIFDV
jgi:SHS2 domain-containing protein